MKYLIIIFLSMGTINSQIYDLSIPQNDTASYNYADFRIWINESIDTLKGIYWFMHPNNGDSRDFVYDTNYQNLATNKNFALMGAHIFNMHMNTGIGDATIAATDSFSILSNHEELLHIPFFINGYSWGGQFAFHFTKWIPERVLGFITQKGGFHDTSIVDNAIQVPGLMFIGEDDLDYRIENLTNIFLNHRPLGAKWALAMEPNTGHSQIIDFNFLDSYFNKVVDLRIPHNVNVFEPITLNILPNTIGWLGNQNSWIIGSWECYDGIFDSSSWLPSNSIAEHWQNFVSGNSTSDTSSCTPSFDSTYAFFTVGIHGEDETSDFIIITNDTDKINLCRAQLELDEENRLLHVNGYIDSTDGGFNQPWSWHIIPNEWVLAEMSIGLCNGTPEQLEYDLDYWLNNVGQLCNWSSFIKNEIIFDSLCNSNEIELWNECYSIENTTDLNLSNSGNGNWSGNGPLGYVDLPFTFKFYGIEYNQITVCTNGWISPGYSGSAAFRNYPIPGAGGPTPMIAAFWDDLTTGNNGDVYVSSNNQYVIIQWEDMRTDWGNDNNTFQIIIYNDSAQPNGDNSIKIQYQDFNNTSSGSFTSYPPIHGSYATIGIENHLGSVGLQYTFNDQYPNAATELQNQSALFITTQSTTVLTSGDVNQDDDINILDVVMVINHILSVESLDSIGQFVADIDSNGDINILDVILMINLILNS